jgi:hypothetical protein
MSSVEQLRHSLLEYLQRAVTLVSVDALPSRSCADNDAAAAEAHKITDASANVAMLCDALQRALSHGLRAQSVLWMNASVPSLWSALGALGVASLSAATKDAVAFISADVLDDESRAAALVRWLLNERCCERLCRFICGSERLAKFYDADALVRREDAQSILLTIAAALGELEFRLCVSAADQLNAAAASRAGKSRPHVPLRGFTVPLIDGDDLAVAVDEDASFIKRRPPQVPDRKDADEDVVVQLVDSLRSAPPPVEVAVQVAEVTHLETSAAQVAAAIELETVAESVTGVVEPVMAESATTTVVAETNEPLTAAKAELATTVVAETSEPLTAVTAEAATVVAETNEPLTAAKVELATTTIAAETNEPLTAAMAEVATTTVVAETSEPLTASKAELATTVVAETNEPSPTATATAAVAPTAPAVAPLTAAVGKVTKNKKGGFVFETKRT